MADNLAEVRRKKQQQAASHPIPAEEKRARFAECRLHSTVLHAEQPLLRLKAWE